MKFVRWLLISIGILLVLAGAVCGLALLPAVQRWAVLKAAADVPGLKLDVTRVSAGFSGVVLENVAAEKRRIGIKVERLEADFSLTAFLFSRRLEISRLAVTGLEVDASKVDGANAGVAAAGAPAATPGLLASAELPFDLALDNVRIEGKGLVATAANQPPVAARFVVTGGKIAPGHEGLLQLDATVDNPAPGTGVTTLRIQAGLRATLTAQRTFSKISLATVVDATGPALSGESQLKLGADLFHSSAGENYEVTIDTSLKGTRDNVMKFTAQLPAGARQYAGGWDLNVKSAQVEPFLLGVMLPAFDLRGGGKFAFDPSGSAFNLQGSVRGGLSRLEALDPAWKSFGTVKIDTTFDGGQQGDILQLAQLKMTAARETPILTVQTTAPLRYDLKQHRLVAAGATTDNLLKLVLSGVPVEWVKPFAAGADISGGAITGEFDLAPVAGGATAIAVKGRLQATELTVTQDGRPLLTRGNVTLRTAGTLSEATLDVPVLELNVGTPEGDALKVTGKLSRSLVPNPPLTFTGSFTASTKRALERWLPGAPVSAQGEVNLTLRGSTLELQPGRVQLQQAGKSLLDANILQPFAMNLDTQALAPRDAAQPVAKLVVGKLPLALLPVTEPGAVLGGFVDRGEFEVSVRGGKTVVRSLGALRLADVSLTQNRRAALTGLAIEAAPVIEYGNAGDYRVQSGDVTIRAGAAGTLLALKAEATATPGQGSQVSTTFTLEAPLLASQPLFMGAQALSAGRATGEIRAVLGQAQQVEARVTLNGLVASDTNLILPVANIGFRAVMQPTGAGSIQVPILLDNAGRRSDLNFSLALSPLGKGYSVDGKISGQQIDWEDMQGVLGAFLASAAPESDDRPVAAPASVTPDTIAAWSRLSGQVVVDIKSVTRGKEWSMTGLAGTLAIEPTRLSLPKLTAAFGDTSRLNAKMELRFTGGPMPYRLTGDYALNDFDVGKLFKALDATKAPTVDGLFNVSSTFSGNGETVQRAIDRVHGDFQLTSHEGIFRGLQRSTNKLSMTSKAVESVASLLGSIINSEKATKAAEKVAGSAYYVDQLAQSLGELKYDQLSVKLTRDELLNMNLQDISLVAPELRLTGRAEVTYVAGKPMLEQPLSASLDLAARGKIEEQLGKLRLLSGTKDDLGYSKAKETVTVGGTLGKPDATAFFTKIATAKVSDLLDSGN